MMELGMKNVVGKSQILRFFRIAKRIIEHFFSSKTKVNEK